MALKIVCAWCGRVLSPGPEGPVSHGICSECEKKEAQKFQEWLQAQGRPSEAASFRPAA